MEPCPHPVAESLGLSSGVAFLRCMECGDVLVVDREREWSIGSDPSAAEDWLRARP